MTLYFTKPKKTEEPCCGHGAKPRNSHGPREDRHHGHDCQDPPNPTCDGPVQTATTMNDPDDPSSWKAIDGKTTWIKKGNVLVGFVQPCGEVCLLNDEVSPDTEGCTAMVDCNGCAKIDLRQLAGPGSLPVDFRTFTITEYPLEGLVANNGQGEIKFTGQITEPQKLSFQVSDTAGNESNVSCVIFLPYESE